MLVMILTLLLVPLSVLASSSDDDNSCDRSTLTKAGRIGWSHGIMRIEGELTITYNKGNEWCTYLKRNKKYLYRCPLREIKRQAFIAGRFAALEQQYKKKKFTRPKCVSAIDVQHQSAESHAMQQSRLWSHKLRSTN